METPQPTTPVPVTENRQEPADARARRLIRLARARGVLDLALGQGLRALSKGNRLSKEGAARLSDFAREHLGLGRSCALGLMRLAEQLPVLPRLRAALQAGELTSRQVLTALPLASELPDAALVNLALRHTIRQVQSLVDASGRSPDEPFDSAVLLMTPGQQARLEAAFEFARTELGANAPDWRCLEALCQEYANLGTTPDPGEDFRPDLRADAERWLETWRRFGAEVETLERELAGGAGMFDGAQASASSDGAQASAAPDGAQASASPDGAQASASPDGAQASAAPGGPPGPFTDLPSDWLDPDTAVLLADALATIDAESAPVPRPDDARLTGLRAHLVLLADTRTRWQVAFGRLAREVRLAGAWRSVSRTWGEFCHHELGLDPKTVRGRIRFEEALLRLPPLRAALLAREVNYSAAQIVARHARPDTLHALLARAKDIPVLDLRAELEGERKRKMCERNQVPVSGPRTILAFTKDAIAAAQLTAWVQGEHVTPGEAQARVADHFVKVWTEAVLRRDDRRSRVLLRNGGLCVVPGCSNAAAHVHHIVFQSHGGPSEDWNLAGVCASHHLHCIHLGFMRVRGRADGVLVFEMGLRGGRPVEVYTMAAGEAPRRVPMEGPASSVEAPVPVPATGPAAHRAGTTYLGQS